MKYRLLILLTLLVGFGGFSTEGNSQAIGDFVSPDNSLIARIAPINKTSGNESGIQILTASGSLLFEKKYGSLDHQQGAVVDRASWSADSKFFIYSAYNSGGHQPMIARIFCYSRANNAVYSIGDNFSQMLDSEFRMVPGEPDAIEIYGQRSAGDAEAWEKIKPVCRS